MSYTTQYPGLDLNRTFGSYTQGELEYLAQASPEFVEAWKNKFRKHGLSKLLPEVNCHPYHIFIHLCDVEGEIRRQAPTAYCNIWGGCMDFLNSILTQHGISKAHADLASFYFFKYPEMHGMNPLQITYYTYEHGLNVFREGFIKEHVSLYGPIPSDYSFS